MAPIHIILADDDPDQLDITATLLRAEGYQVDTAASGGDALRRIVDAPPDIVLCDVEMPGLTGLQVAQKMKADPVLRNVPVILMSGRRITPRDRVDGLDQGDDYILKPFTPDELIARVRAMVRRTQIGLDANPLTRLPGNSSILREIEGLLAREEPFAILYADLNHFKSYNDRYGFLRGDEVIRFTARTLLAAVDHCLKGDFVGHVGGDDFVVMTTPERAEPVCQRIMETFDKGIGEFYTPEDAAQGGLEVKDRKGQKEFIPIMGIAIGVVTNAKRPIASVGEVSQIGAELKKFAKSQGGSRFVVDQRGRPPRLS